VTCMILGILATHCELTIVDFLCQRFNLFYCTCLMPHSLHLCLFVPGERKHPIFDGVSTRWDTVDSHQNSIIFATDLLHKQNLIQWAGRDRGCVHLYMCTWIPCSASHPCHQKQFCFLLGCCDFRFWVITGSS
jgi:hypothetical protein